MTIDNQQLAEVTLGVCETMLGLELMPREPLPVAWTRDLQATIRITGEWNATLEVSCCQNAAKQIASVMFAMDEKELSDTEVVDAIAEIVNMIGGNIKGMVGGESLLSLPCVDTQPEPLSSPSEGTTDVAFHLPGAELNVRLRNTAYASSACATT